MSKKNNSFVSELLFFLIVFVGALFIYLFTLNEIRSLTKSKDALEELLTQKTNDAEQLIVSVQQLSSEDRIVRLAMDSLGLVRSPKNYEILYIDENQVKRVERIVKSKYE